MKMFDKMATGAVRYLGESFLKIKRYVIGQPTSSTPEVRLMRALAVIKMFVHAHREATVETLRLANELKETKERHACNIKDLTMTVDHHGRDIQEMKQRVVATVNKLRSLVKMSNPNLDRVDKMDERELVFEISKLYRYHSDRSARLTTRMIEALQQGDLKTLQMLEWIGYGMMQMPNLEPWRQSPSYAPKPNGAPVGDVLDEFGSITPLARQHYAGFRKAGGTHDEFMKAFSHVPFLMGRTLELWFQQEGSKDGGAPSL